MRLGAKSQWQHSCLLRFWISVWVECAEKQAGLKIATWIGIILQLKFFPACLDKRFAVLTSSSLNL